MPRDSPARSFLNPHEESLHTFCKQMLKSRLFKGFYKERCYVDEVNGYRDLIVLNRSEKELKNILEDVRNRLVQFYQYSPSPVWIGISTAPNVLSGNATDTCIWVELDELAFDQYWFSVKAVRFKGNEIIIKLKPIRAVEIEVETSSSLSLTKDPLKEAKSISLQDFAEIVSGWGTSIKYTVYEFMSNDISKENLKAVLRFLSLIAISLLTGAVAAIRFIGIFTLRFMVEFRKLLVVSTPIFMRIIDLCGKVVGGFYILIAMIWRDTAGGGKQQNNQQRTIAYNRPIYQSLKYK